MWVTKKDTVLSSRKTCLHEFLMKNWTASAPNNFMGIQGGGDRTVKCPPVHKLGNWHSIFPG